MNSSDKPSEVPVQRVRFTMNPFDSLFEKVALKVQDADPKGKIGVKWYFERADFLFEFWPWRDRVIYEYTEIQCSSCHEFPSPDLLDLK